VFRLTCQVIVISSLLSNVIQTDLAVIQTLQCLSMPLNQLDFSVIQTLQLLSVPSNHLDFSVIQTLQWLSVPLNHLDFSVIQTLQWLNMHLHSGFLQLNVAMSLYKDTPSWNASSHFTHTLSLHSHTILFNMPHYLIPTWNECPLCHCGRRAKIDISLVSTTYERRCWVCPDTNPSDYIGFYISISYIDGSNSNTATNIDGLMSTFLVRFLWMDRWGEEEPNSHTRRQWTVRGQTS
jgi:hypothetical protein